MGTVTCKWSLRDNETHAWISECGKTTFVISGNTPIENGWKKCPFCGKKLAQNTRGYIPNFDKWNPHHYQMNLDHLRGGK